MAFPFLRRRRRDPEVIGSDAPDAYSLGRYLDEDTGRVGPKLQIPGSEAIIIVGRNRSGKDAGIGNYNGLRLQGQSIVFLDVRGEAAAICAPYRRTLGPTYIINPFGLLTDIPGYGDLKSDGWSALDEYNALDPFLFERASGIAEAIHKQEGKDPHWPLRARTATTGLAMDEVEQAANEGRPALLTNIRARYTEAAEHDPVTGEPTKGFIATARRLAKHPNFQIASAMGNFTEDNDETRSVLATGDGQSLFLASRAIHDDELKSGIRLSELGERPVSLFVVMPAEMVQADAIYSVFLRLVIGSALNSLMRPRPTGCTFYLNEFASLGRLQPVEASMGLVAGSGGGNRLVIVVQSLSQLKQIYEHGWENFVGQAAALALVGAPADRFTAEYLSARSGEMTICQPNAGLQLNPNGVGMSSGEAYTRRRFLMEQDLYGLQPGYGYVWVAGLSNAIPVYFPPYWDVEATAAVARKNPYYRG